MDTKKAIEFLEIYFTKNRRRGHTTAMLNGAKSNKNIMVIVADNQQKKNIDLPNKQMIVINELDRLKGTQKPLLIDHYALQIIFYHMLKLLQRSEKFEAMWEEMLHRVNQIHPLHLNGEDIRRIINDIIQKYSPKPSDNFTEKVMEKINKESEVRSNVDSKTNI